MVKSHVFHQCACVEVHEAKRYRDRDGQGESSAAFKEKKAVFEFEEEPIPVSSCHSLRVAGASSLFDAGVPERIIQARTGHRSLESLRLYERVTERQDMQVAKILTGESTSFSINDSGSNNNTVMPCNPIESTETKPEMYASPSTNSPVYSSAAGQQYNNCTVNIFAPPDNTYFPYPPPPPPFW